MRAVNELRSLASEAGLVWARFFTRMGFWFCLGFAVQLGANLLSVRLGAQYNVVATVVFVVGLIASVIALILMIHACEPALRTVARVRDSDISLAPGTPSVPDQVFRHEPVLDVLAMTVGPFLAVYAVWGLVDDEVSWLFVINVALTGLGGVNEWSVNLQWVTFYVVLALIAWLLRQLVALVARRTGRVWLLAPAVLLEGLWVVGSFLALFAVGRQGLEWLEGRAVWQGARQLWFDFLEWLPEIVLPFDLTLPEAVAAAAEWVWSSLLPGFALAVLLPLMWLALTATVFGWREFTGRDVLEGTVAQASARRWQEELSRRESSPAWALVIRASRLLTGDLRTKYVPVASAFRLVLRAGPRFVGAYLLLAATLSAGQRFLELGVDWVIGPQAQGPFLARVAFTDLAVSLLFATVSTALYVAAFDRVLAASVGTRSGVGRSPAGSGTESALPRPAGS